MTERRDNSPPGSDVPVIRIGQGYDCHRLAREGGARPLVIGGIPFDSPVGPVITVTWERVPKPDSRLEIGVEEDATSITYRLDPSLMSQHAADYLSRLDTERSPYWQRVPQGYHDSDDVE